MADSVLKYDDDELVMDLAKADLSVIEIAAKHGMTPSNVYMIASGRSRPELMTRINELCEGAHAEGRRLARTRARFWLARLVQLANSPDEKIALNAVQTGLEACGLLDSEGTKEEKRRTIEIILTAKGDGDMAKRFTGVYNGNGEVN